MPDFKNFSRPTKKVKRIFKNNSIFKKANVILKIGTTKRSTEYMCNFEN